jgi:hypothetical protein
MSVWLCLPSKRPHEETQPVFEKWADLGYNVAIQVDADCSAYRTIGNFFRSYRGSHETVEYYRDYCGYANAVNFLSSWVFRRDTSCEWIIAAGDDTFPDPNRRADDIAAELTQHFKGTFGVMQPTGDPWSDPRGRLIERIAGSPWLGRDWCLRANGGRGPLWPWLFHMWADEALQLTAQQLGVFWQRPDLTHFHQHWGRPREGERFGDHTRMPAFLARANSTDQTDADRAEFERLKRGGFKECFPL